MIDQDEKVRSLKTKYCFDVDLDSLGKASLSSSQIYNQLKFLHSIIYSLYKMSQAKPDYFLKKLTKIIWVDENLS